MLRVVLIIFTLTWAGVAPQGGAGGSAGMPGMPGGMGGMGGAGGMGGGGGGGDGMPGLSSSISTEDFIRLLGASPSQSGGLTPACRGVDGVQSFMESPDLRKSAGLPFLVKLVNDGKKECAKQLFQRLLK